MGTPDFAVGVLKEMVNAGKKIVGVITVPDKPAGRGRKLTMSAVKEYAISQNLRILQPTNLKDEYFFEWIKRFKRQSSSCCCIQNASKGGVANAWIGNI